MRSKLPRVRSEFRTATEEVESELLAELELLAAGVDCMLFGVEDELEDPGAALPAGAPVLELLEEAAVEDTGAAPEVVESAGGDESVGVAVSPGRKPGGSSDRAVAVS